VAHTAKSNWEHKGLMTGTINKVSSKARDVIPGSDIVIICSPAQTKNQLLADIKPFIKDGCMLGSIFGQGAFDW